MFFMMTFPEKAEEFEQGLKAVEEAYWPIAQLLERGLDPKLEELAKEIQIQMANMASQRLDESEPLKRLVQDIDESFSTLVREAIVNAHTQPAYKLFVGGEGKEKLPLKSLPLPFIERFHELLSLPRQGRSPENVLGRTLHVIDRVLDRDQMKAHLWETYKLENYRESTNYFKNGGNYNHFINTVAATARLVHYFSDEAHVIEHLHNTDDLSMPLDPASTNGMTEWFRLYKTVTYRNDDEQRMRILNLMFAAFYHDLGKTLVDARHGMEGANILSFHTTDSVFELGLIARETDNDLVFEHEDLFFISDLVLFHDLYGTFCTGECGYLKLVDILYRINKYSFKHHGDDSSRGEREDQVRWSQRYLFDLWILNVADIIVSVDNKFSPQHDWKNGQKANHRIRDFLRGRKGSDLLHDLRLSFKLITTQNRHKHVDSTSSLMNETHMLTERHVIERIRRLINEVIKNAVVKDFNVDRITERFQSYLQKLKREVDSPPRLNVVELETLYQNIKIYIDREENQISTIMRAIRSFGNYREYCRRLAYIGSMDYALAFFEKIARRILTEVEKDIMLYQVGLGEPKTHWIKLSPRKREIDAKSGQYIGVANVKEHLWRSYSKAQAKIFLDNYTATVIQIIGHLLFREASIEGLRNLEFKEANERLTDEKIDAIVALEGPSRAKRTIELVLKTIFYW